MVNKISYEKFMEDIGKDMSNKYKKVDTKVEHVGTGTIITVKARDLINKEDNNDSSIDDKKES